MKKTLAALALAGSITLTGAISAQAYVSPQPSATVSDATVAPGEQFIFSGQGMAPNEPVTITVTPVDAAGPAAGSQSVAAKISIFQAPQTLSTTANAQGAFSLPIAISEAGTYSLTATGNISGNTVGPVTVTVAASLASTGGDAAAPLASTGSGLANTGADSGLILWTLVGAGALAAGATSVVVVRRRANAEVAA